jgi:hypothetical protein
MFLAEQIAASVTEVFGREGLKFLAEQIAPSITEESGLFAI